MYLVKVILDFCAAHNLRDYKGICENLHGHNYRVELVLKRKNLPKDGMVFDFKKAKSILKEVISDLDHSYLNEFPYFLDKNPSAENIATYIYNEVKRRLDEKDVSIFSVEVWESSTSSATYIGEES